MYVGGRGFRTYGRQQEAERARKDVGREDGGDGSGGGRGAVWDGLINRVSDSTHFCPWDESSRAHRRCAASGNCG